MKTTTLKALLINGSIILMIANLAAQDLIGTRIDLQGTSFTDKLWIFSVQKTTRNYDSGWDGYKMFGGEFSPQFFAWEDDGDYQIDVVPDLNNTYIGFKAGGETVYTITFNYQNIDQGYQHLYLIDSVANKTIDIYADGTSYTFSASITTTAVKRFKIVTSLPVVLPPALSNDNISEVPAVVNSRDKKIKIYSSNKTIFVENSDSQNGKLNIYNASSGALVKNADFNGNEKTTIETDLPKGVYVLKGKTLTEELCTKVVIN